MENLNTDLTPKAKDLIAKRYSLKDQNGNPTENWEQIAKRVVTAVMGDRPNAKAVEKLIRDRVFIPNTPCLVNAGKPGGGLAACFVLDVPDSIDGIMQHAQVVAKIHKQGGGTGMSYEKVRPMGSRVTSSGGAASGPVSFMNIVNTVTEVVKQGGVRRGANMGILRVDHPDILRFIHAKNDQTSLTNFNISVTVTDEFMKAVENQEWFQLRFEGQNWEEPVFDPVTEGEYKLFANPTEGFLSFCDQSDYENRKGSIVSQLEGEVGKVYAPDVWNRICASAHKYGEPGIIFIDEVNRHNYLMNTLGPLFATNPCGEQAIHGNQSCNLGSIDVSKLWQSENPPPSENCGISGFNFDRFKEVINLAVEFLDAVVDVSAWATPEIKEIVTRTRPIGLGMMGIADLLILAGLPYNIAPARQYIANISKFFQEAAWQASLDLGERLGTFPDYEPNKSLYDNFFADLFGCNCEGPNETHPQGWSCKAHSRQPRNYEVTTIAPTGSISLIAGCSSGIEPNFAWLMRRADTVSTRDMIHPLVASYFDISLNYDDEKMFASQVDEIQSSLSELPDYFIMANEIAAQDHLLMMAAAAPFIDNSISKTCNAFATDSVKSVDELFRLAHKEKVKAVTYYRDGSRDGQVLSDLTGKSETAALTETQPEQTISNEKVVIPTRPQYLQGGTWKIPFDGKNLYVTVNNDGVNILEVFVGGNLIDNAVGVLASKMLRGGFTVDQIVDDLDAITGTHSVWFNKRLITSPAQAVATCLKMMSEQLREGQGNHEFVKAEFNKSENIVAENGKQPVSGYECPGCNSKTAVQKQGNCYSCLDCGWSKC